jgi:sigma-B regulation protein RsbQ
MDTIERNNVHIQGNSGPVLVRPWLRCNQTMWNRITPAFAGTHKQVLFDLAAGSGQPTSHRLTQQSEALQAIRHILDRMH